MCTFERIRWLTAEVSSGRLVMVTFSFNGETEREKVKIVLGDSYDLKSIYRPCLLGSLCFLQQATSHIVVFSKVFILLLRGVLRLNLG